MIRHSCGLVGISGHQEAARHAYFGLYAQQHRGQESAGIATWDGARCMSIGAGALLLRCSMSLTCENCLVTMP